MSRFILLCSIVVVAACTDSLADSIQPKFYPEYFTGLETQNITQYKTAKLDYDLTSRNGGDMHFTNCNQVAKTPGNDIVASEYHLLTMLKINCKALKMYARAGVSKKSYLDDLLVNKDIRNLPATAYPFVSEHDRQTRLGKKLKDYQKKLAIKLARDGAIEVETETDRLIYQIISTGDFNGDKIEDALIRIDWRVIGAFGKGSKLMMITKMSAEKDFEEMKLSSL